MNTNFQNLRTLLFTKNYAPANRMFTTGEEVKKIRSTLELENMDVTALRNLRDFTVLFCSTQNSSDREKYDRNLSAMQSIVMVIDSAIHDAGGKREPAL